MSESHPYKLSALLQSLESLSSRYQQAKLELQDDAALREIVDAMDFTLAQVTQLTGAPPGGPTGIA